jgi:hypothetical protein
MTEELRNKLKETKETIEKIERKLDNPKKEKVTKNMAPGLPEPPQDKSLIDDTKIPGVIVGGPKIPNKWKEV